MIIFQMAFRINSNFKCIQQRYYIIIYYVYKINYHHKTQGIKKNDGYPCLYLNVCQYNKKIIISRRIYAPSSTSNYKVQRASRMRDNGRPPIIIIQKET